MDDRNTKTRSSVELVEELIQEEILPRLPVKSLLRFKCVSKSWRSLIDSKRFIEKHLQNSRNGQNRDNWSVVLNCIKHGLTINAPTDDHLMRDGRVVGCSNGLVCIANVEELCFFLWNPSTRISVELPEIDLEEIEITRYGFGWDERSNAYKVFVGMLYVDDHEPLGKVYSSKTNSWKTVEHGSLDGSCSTGTFSGGRIHWLTTDGYIETFDLESEVFGMIELPCNKPHDGGFWMWLWEIEGCLSLVCDSFDWNKKRRIWVMKESWVEEISPAPIKKINRCCEAFFYPQTLVSPLPQKNW